MLAKEWIVRHLKSMKFLMSLLALFLLIVIGCSDNPCTADKPDNGYMSLKVLMQGEDPNGPPGPYIYMGDWVEWTYIVINTGNTIIYELTIIDDFEAGIVCSGDTIAQGDTLTYSASARSVWGDQRNIAKATGRTSQNMYVAAEDTSYYSGYAIP